MTFYGDAWIETVLPQGTPVQVKVATRRYINVLAPNSTGLIVERSKRML